MSIPTSEAAHAAWGRRYSTRRVELTRNDSEPFEGKEWLGRGGVSEVHKTDLGNGILVALKRVNFMSREREFYVNELNILEKLSGTRHRHIVELIGCYELPRGRYSQIGILVWPVAQCDLSGFLASMDGVVDLYHSFSERDISKNTPRILNGKEREALEEVLDLTRPQWQSSITLQKQDHAFVWGVLDNASDRLCKVFGCLAEAISYLHNDQKIRHKDMKPSQVLMSPHGLWLTDFGWSTDISGLSNSATNNGYTTSPKYLAPERAARGQYCGRSEDIFALGCIYLEMAYRLCRISPITDLLNPGGLNGWSYHANLDQADGWLAPLLKSSNAAPDSLVGLIRIMIDRDAAERPLINDVVEILREEVSGVNRYFSSCCSV